MNYRYRWKDGFPLSGHLTLNCLTLDKELPGVSQCVGVRLMAVGVQLMAVVVQLKVVVLELVGSEVAGRRTGGPEFFSGGFPKEGISD